MLPENPLPAPRWARPLWARWTIATALPGLLGTLALNVLVLKVVIPLIRSSSNKDFETYLLSAVLMGAALAALVSFCQQRVLRRALGTVQDWLPLSVATLPGVVVVLLVGKVPPSLALLANVALVVAVALVGLVQALALRRHARLGGWWFLASFVALASGIAIGTGLNRLGLLVLGEIVGWLVYAVVGGLALTLIVEDAHS